VRRRGTHPRPHGVDHRGRVRRRWRGHGAGRVWLGRRVEWSQCREGAARVPGGVVSARQARLVCGRGAGRGGPARLPTARPPWRSGMLRSARLVGCRCAARSAVGPAGRLSLCGSVCGRPGWSAVVVWLGLRSARLVGCRCVARSAVGPARPLSICGPACGRPGPPAVDPQPLLPSPGPTRRPTPAPPPGSPSRHAPDLVE